MFGIGVGIAVIPAPAFAGINLVPAKAGTYCESRNLLRKQEPIVPTLADKLQQGCVTAAGIHF